MTFGAFAIAQQSTPPPVRQEFDVASVKPNKSSELAASANIPLGPGTVFPEVGGHFSATNIPLMGYISFGWKLQGNQGQALVSQMPAWVLSDRFDIQAEVAGHPGKDDMRMMMRALLADRFKLAIRSENRQVNVFGLVLGKAGKTGKWFQAHLDGSCSTNPPPSDTEAAGEFPALCGGVLPVPHPPGYMNKFGARNVSLEFIANQITALGHLDRPVLDQTGLNGNWDFALQWVPDVPGADPEALAAGPSFLEALAEQMGLKLVSQKAPAEFLVLDHVEHPSDN